MTAIAVPISNNKFCGVLNFLCKLEAFNCQVTVLYVNVIPVERESYSDDGRRLVSAVGN